MAVPTEEAPSGMGTNARSDIFLHVQTKRAGKIKGEASTEGHIDDIVVRAWAWGAQAGSAIGSTSTTARRSYRPLVVIKGIDASSLGLLSALTTNDEVREARLTMRKGGGEALDYYQMTLSGARVTDIAIDVDERGWPVEKVIFTYTKIELEYKRQDGRGGGGAAVTFIDEVLAAK